MHINGFSGRRITLQFTLPEKSMRTPKKVFRGAVGAMAFVVAGGLLVAAAPAPQITDDTDDPAVWGQTFPDH
jgi:hypothetical protein